MLCKEKSGSPDCRRGTKASRGVKNLPQKSEKSRTVEQKVLIFPKCIY
jgi:hypothetical protein